MELEELNGLYESAVKDEEWLRGFPQRENEVVIDLCKEIYRLRGVAPPEVEKRKGPKPRSR